MNKRTYTPFMRPMRCPEICGVYRNKETGKMIKFTRVWIRGFIDCQKTPEEPYDGYQGIWQFEGDEPIKNCIIEPHTLNQYYEKVFNL